MGCGLKPRETDCYVKGHINMTTEIQICFPGEIQNKFQFCARTNTFVTTVLPHSRGGVVHYCPIAKSVSVLITAIFYNSVILTGTGGAIGAAHTACAWRVRVSELHPVTYFLQTNTWEEEKGLRKSFVI